MTVLQAILLGIIQGLTEFLPISSSGHLILSQYLLGLQKLDELILFDLTCHMGTLVAILFFFRTQLKIILLYDWTKIKQVILGTLPLFLLAPFITHIKHAYEHVEYLGYFFLINAFILYMGLRIGNEKRQLRHERPILDPFLIGFGQMIAIFPGISRSGSTISTAKMLGWETYQAVFFSFLLAIPAMAGGTCYELYKQVTHIQSVSTVIIPTTAYVSAFVTSLITGFFSLRLLLNLALKDRFMYFVWYSLLVGIVTLIVVS